MSMYVYGTTFTSITRQSSIYDVHSCFLSSLTLSSSESAFPFLPLWWLTVDDGESTTHSSSWFTSERLASLQVRRRSLLLATADIDDDEQHQHQQQAYNNSGSQARVFGTRYNVRVGAVATTTDDDNNAHKTRSNCSKKGGMLRTTSASFVRPSQSA